MVINKLLARLNSRHPRLRVVELERLLTHRGYVLEAQRGSHRRWVRADGRVVVLVDHGLAKPYQIKDVREAMK